MSLGDNGLPFAGELRSLAAALRAQAKAQHQRRLLVLAGDAAWCRQAAVLCSAEIASCWISSQAPAACESLMAQQAISLLGQERALLVFDAHAGFDPDAFGAASGSVVAGGLLILLTPPLERWEQMPDPACERIAVAPYEFQDVSGRFLRRLAGLLSTSGETVIVRRGDPLPTLPAATVPASPAVFADAPYRTPDQQQAVAEIRHVLHGHRRRPLVLVSDRGRGKSAALGIAAAQLLQEGTQKILVTAPRLEAVEPLFAMARQLLPQAEAERGLLRLGEAVIAFKPPDELCQTSLDAELLLVDEAAAIPAQLLQVMLQRYSRIVFASTVHGYEGTGRGFAVRFRRHLDEQAPDWHELRLATPIRWADNDPLERWVFRALLLDANAAADADLAGATAASCEYQYLDRDALAADEQTLGQLFGLLVQAHYRTRPMDLRNLLDGPGLTVYVARFWGQVVATALVSREGGFEPDMAEAIFAGRRRPRGHLIPQSLATHVGLVEGARLSCARIMRIAVHPALQRRGVGSALLAVIRDQAKLDGCDLLGASFGLTLDLLPFWRREGMRPVRVGFSRDHASGTHSAIVLQPLSEAGEALCSDARRRFLEHFPLLLAEPLAGLDAELAARLLQQDAPPGELSAEELGDCRSFAFARRSYADCLAPLWRLTCAVLASGDNGLAMMERRILVAKLLQHRDWPALAAMLELPGRGAALARLREAVASALNSLLAR